MSGYQFSIDLSSPAVKVGKEQGNTGKCRSHVRKREWLQVERAARTIKGWIKRKNRAGDGNGEVPWNYLSSVICPGGI